MRNLGSAACGAVLLLTIVSLGCQAGVSSGTLSASGGGSYTLTVSKVGGAASGTVSSSPAGISCGAACTSASHAFDAGTNVVLTAAAAAGYTFDGWSGSGISCPGTGTCTVSMGVARTVTATFTQNSATQYTLQLNRAGTGTGTVTSAPAGISCGSDCAEPFDPGTVVTLTAAAGAGSSFASWSGGGCSGSGTCRVTMNGNRTVTATFNLQSTGPYTLTVTRTGSGTVTSDPAGISCGADCTEQYAADTDVTLTAAPGNGYTFAGWSGSGVNCPGTGTCTVTMSAARSVLARFTSGDTGDLCDGLVTDKLNRPRTSVPKPALGAAYLDPNFGTTIRRITDAAARGVNVIKPVYSTIQAWNVDESYLILYHTEGSPSGHFLYQGKAPYALIKALNISPADLEQVYWSPTDPKILYYTNITTKRLTAFNVDTNAATVVKDFSQAPVSCTQDITGGSDPMWTSWDGCWFGYTCGRSTGSKMYVYNRCTDTIGTIYTGDTGGNAPQAAPSGTLFYLNPGDALAQVRDANMNILRTIDVAGGEHATIGTADGVDTHFSIQFDTNPVGNVVAVNMTNGQKRVIIGQGVAGWPQYPVRGTHLSAVAYQNPGWLVMDAVGEGTGQTLLDNEVVLINANTGGSICRIGHHHSCGSASNGGDACDTVGQQGYWAEPHATISPSGTRVLFASDWRGESRVESYVIELPSYRP